MSFIAPELHPCSFGTTVDECRMVRERRAAGRSNTIESCPMHGPYPAEDIDDRPGFPGCTTDGHAPGCPCMAGGDVVPADPDGWLPAPLEPEWADAPAGAGDDVEAYRG